MAAASNSGYNIRVYGVWVNENQVLLSEEERFGVSMTKFPGGGVEWGEGLADALLRELKEETGAHFRILSHLYTTDFFVASAFHPNQQLLSVYYRVEPIELFNPFDLSNQQANPGEQVSFRWHQLQDLTPEVLTFPIDRHVALLLRG